MLDLVTTIRQRHETFKRFDREWVDPKTKKPHLKPGTNEPRPFILNSLRKACPIKASDAYKDDPEFQTALSEAEKLYAAQVDILATHAKKISKLEIAARENKLRKQFHEGESFPRSMM